MTLSDKMFTSEHKGYVPMPCIAVEDVKEFIKELKDKISPLPEHWRGTVCIIIDKLAGKELTHSPEIRDGAIPDDSKDTSDGKELSYSRKLETASSGTHSQQGNSKHLSSGLTKPAGTKTLKDLFLGPHEEEVLKQEAIKWVKKYMKEFDDLPDDYNIAKSRAAGGEEAIRSFFSITEDDLK